MSDVLMLDLGETLIHANTVLPHVPEALRALSQFTDAEGKPISVCLVSDFETPAPPATPAKINAIFAKYLKMLREFGLLGFFEPTSRRVTLSTHAGVSKPDKKIFLLAIKRLGVQATLSDCVFITENELHIKHCREKLHMKTVQFGKDFQDWREAPFLVARQFGLPGNMNTALAGWGEAHGLSGLSMTASPDSKGALRAQCMRWVPVSSPTLGKLSGVHVNLPAAVELSVDQAGRIGSFKVEEPSPDAVAESIHFVRGLVERGNVEGHGVPSGFQEATHRIEKDAQGRSLLRRKGFSAV